VVTGLLTGLLTGVDTADVVALLEVEEVVSDFTGVDTGELAGVDALLLVVATELVVTGAEVFTGVLAEADEEVELFTGVLTAAEDEDEAELLTGVEAADEAELLVDLVLGIYVETDFLVLDAFELVAGADETPVVLTGAEETGVDFTEEEAEVFDALETLLLLVGGWGWGP
jgi:hypothetical protein